MPEVFSTRTFGDGLEPYSKEPIRTSCIQHRCRLSFVRCEVANCSALQCRGARHNLDLCFGRCRYRRPLQRVTARSRNRRRRNHLSLRVFRISAPPATSRRIQDSGRYRRGGFSGRAAEARAIRTGRAQPSNRTPGSRGGDGVMGLRVLRRADSKRLPRLRTLRSVAGCRVSGVSELGRKPSPGRMVEV
jgi:hypothetical protein